MTPTETKVFVTGGGGFLGRHLLPTMRRNGWRVTAPASRECDLRSATGLERYTGERYDYVFHLAAWTQAGDFCDTRRGEQWVVNQQINTNVLAWWHDRQPQAKMIAFGTSVSYPKDVELTEENYMAAPPVDRYAAYAECKRALLIGLQSLQRQFGHRFLYLIPSTLYGPLYPLDGRQLHFIYDLIRKILRGRDHAERVVLWGDGFQKRELVYAEDFVAWLLELAARVDNEVVNLGAGEEYTIRDFAGVICDAIGFPPEKIEFDPQGFVGAKSKFLAVKKLERLLPHRPRTPLDTGLRQTIAWFAEHRAETLPAVSR